MSRLTDFVNEEMATIDRYVKPSEYGLERGELVEEMVAGAFGLCGVVAGRYNQEFPRNGGDPSKQKPYPAILRSKREDFTTSKDSIKGYQRDLWVAGGATGKRYPVEVKERRHPYGKSIFSYPDIFVGKTENWDLKNALASSKPGYKDTLAIVIVCGHTGEMRVTPTNLQAQEYWKVTRQDHELSYTVPVKRFVTFETFIKTCKTL